MTPARELSKHVEEQFKFLENSKYFISKQEIAEGDTFSVSYTLKEMGVKLGLGHADFSMTIFKNEPEGRGVSLSNLLGYLYQNKDNAPRSDYFRQERVSEARHRKQLKHLADILSDNLEIINNFFHDEHFESNMKEVGELVRKKYPYLFATQSRRPPDERPDV